MIHKTRNMALTLKLLPYCSVLSRLTSVSSDGGIVFQIAEKDFKAIIRSFLHLVPFDEIEYLRYSSDLAAAMAQGKYRASALTHFVDNGYFEGRRPFPAFLAGSFDEIMQEGHLPDDYYDLLYDASVSASEGRFKDAENVLTELVQQYPGRSRPLRLLALCYSRRGQPRLAHSALKALPSDQLSVDDLKGLSGACRALHLHDDSLMYMQLAINLQPNADSALLGQLAAVQFQCGMLYEARSALARIDIAQLGGDGTATYALLKRLTIDTRKRVRELIRSQRKYLGNASDKIELAYHLARLGFRKMADRQLNPALRILRSVSDLPQEAIYFVTEAARLCRGAKGALNALQHLGTQKSDVSSIANECKLLYLSHQYEKCRNRLDGIDPSDLSVDAVQLAFDSALMSGRSEDALDICTSWPADLRNSANWSASTMTALFALRRLADAQVAISAPAQTDNCCGETAKIPAHITQYWNDEVVPEDVLDCMNTWKSNNPTFTYVRFNDSSAAAFLQKEFGIEAYLAFLECTSPAMKADYLRLGYLYSFGGCYIDADERSVGPLAYLIQNFKDKSLIVVRNHRMTLFNSPVFCVPKHRIIEKAFTEATRVLLEAVRSQKPLNVWQATGPGLLTKLFLEAILAGDENVLRESAIISEWDSSRFSREETFGYKASPSRNWRLS